MFSLGQDTLTDSDYGSKKGYLENQNVAKVSEVS